MTNEQIVSEIQNGYSVTDHMQLLYENNLPLISLTLSDTLRADLSVENETIDKIYREHSENELWGIVERFTNDRENDIIREIFLNVSWDYGWGEKCNGKTSQGHVSLCGRDSLQL